MNSLRFGVILGVTGLLSGCGGNVVFSEDGEGGEGASGAASNTTSVTTNQGGGPNSSVTTNQGGGPGSSVTTNQGGGPNSSVVTGPTSTCETLCNEFQQCLEGNCFDQCQQVYQPGCEFEAEQYLQCVINFLSPSCDFPEYDCAFEGEQLSQCPNGNNCFTKGCDAGDASCACTGNCDGNQVVSSCSPNGPGGFVCDCFVNDNYLGACFESEENVCNGIEQSCCVLSFL